MRRWPSKRSQQHRCVGCDGPGGAISLPVQALDQHKARTNKMSKMPKKNQRKRCPQGFLPACAALENSPKASSSQPGQLVLRCGTPLIVLPSLPTRQQTASLCSVSWTLFKESR